MAPSLEFSEMLNATDVGEFKSETVSSGFSISIVYISVFSTLLVMSFVIMCMKMNSIGQKTRSPQQRRMYVGSRGRTSLSQSEPTIYVSPANLPPPPKYEAMAPPSYEEVVGIHYPNYQPQFQPITQPITSAIAQNQSTSSATPDNVTNNNVTTDSTPPTVVTVTSETRRTSVTVMTA